MQLYQLGLDMHTPKHKAQMQPALHTNKHAAMQLHMQQQITLIQLVLQLVIGLQQHLSSIAR